MTLNACMDAWAEVVAYESERDVTTSMVVAIPLPATRDRGSDRGTACDMVPVTRLHRLTPIMIHETGVGE